MGKFHVGPSEESMNNCEVYETTGEVPQPVEVQQAASPAIEIRTEIVEVIKEIKVPEYITVIKEERVEVPVIMEVEKIVEKIVEIPKIQVVKEPVPVVHEVYDVTKVLIEKKAHERTKIRLHYAYCMLAASLVVNLLVLVVK